MTGDICGQGIKPGGQKDVDFVNKHILPYYISQKWLTKAPPKGQKYIDRTSNPNTLLISSHFTCPGWDVEKNKILAKCHKNTYNYCDEGHRKKMKDCVKGVAGSLMVSVMD